MLSISRFGVCIGPSACVIFFAYRNIGCHQWCLNDAVVEVMLELGRYDEIMDLKSQGPRVAAVLESGGASARGEQR